MTATTEEERIRRSRQPAVLAYSFRPMFLAAGSWAIVGLALWLAMFLGYLQLPSRSEPDCMTRLVSEHDQPHIRSPFATAAPTSRFRLRRLC